MQALPRGRGGAVSVAGPRGPRGLSPGETRFKGDECPMTRTERSSPHPSGTGAVSGLPPGTLASPARAGKDGAGAEPAPPGPGVGPVGGAQMERSSPGGRASGRGGRLRPAPLRRLGLADRLVLLADGVISGHPAWPLADGEGPGREPRPSPAEGVPEAPLEPAERRLSAALMRVDHAGEIAAQALYASQALFARDPAVERVLLEAAREEEDHLRWCRERVRELGSHTSWLARLWNGGSMVIGAMAAAGGDAGSLGFVAETERQVVRHLEGHLERLPRADGRSRAVVRQMIADETRHGTRALERGGRLPPPWIRRAMTAASRVMTTLAHRL